MQGKSGVQNAEGITMGGIIGDEGTKQKKTESLAYISVDMPISHQCRDYQCLLIYPC